MTDGRGSGGRERPPVTCDWIATISTALLLIATPFLERGNNTALRLIGVVSLLCSLALIIPPFLLLARHGGVPPGAPYYDTSRVVERGPYAIVRHPQYLGYILLILGIVLLSQHPLTILLGAIAVGSLSVYTVLEERHCERRIGEGYRAYSRRVPRFNFPLGLVRLIVRRRRTPPSP